MPLRSYTLMHPDSKLTLQEVAAVCSGPEIETEE